MSVQQAQTAAVPLAAEVRKRLAEDLRILAALHDRPPTAETFAELRALDFPHSSTLAPSDGPLAETAGLLTSVLAEIPDPPDSGLLDELAADHASIYLNYGIGASPLESVWFDDDGLICQDAMFQVRQWYERHGLGVNDWRVRPDDHLVYQLQFIAFLLEQGEDAGSLEEAATFMDEHLLRWIGSFAERVLQRGGTPWFGAVAAFTAAWCEALRDTLAASLGRPRPSPEEIEERMKPKRPVEEVPVAFMPGMGPVV